MASAKTSKEIQEEEDAKLALQIEKELNGEIENSTLNPSERQTREYLNSMHSRKMVECSSCHTKNSLPLVKADVFLCGECNKQLKTAQGPSSSPSPLQSVQEVTLQIQCGQCNAVNEVQIQSNVSSVQFKCGNCDSINEATL